MTRTQAVIVVIKTDYLQSEAKARERLHHWLETFGHTSVSHGFAFITTEKVNAKHESKTEEDNGRDRPRLETAKGEQGGEDTQKSS